jgi:hypothetical protein
MCSVVSRSILITGYTLSGKQASLTIRTKFVLGLFHVKYRKNNYQQVNDVNAITVLGTAVQLNS